MVYALFSENRQSCRMRPVNAVALAVSVAIAGSVLPIRAALAQTQAVTPAEGEQSDQLQEVVITAQKRAEDLQKVNISATVLSTQDLLDKHVNTIEDLANVAPGLSIQPQSTGESFINIRGVGVQATSPTSSNGVAYYVDGQYIPDNFTNLFSLFDIGSVQVLRGPQGTLVGENATGGAILVTSVQPSLGGTSGYYRQTFGNYGEAKEEGAINFALNDTLAMRAAFVSETENSYTRNLGSGAVGQFNLETPGNVDTQAVRLQLLWAPTSDLSITGRFEKFQSRTDGPAIKPQADPATDPFSAALQNQPYVVAYSAPTSFNVYGNRGALEVKWDLTPAMELRSVTSLQDGHETDAEDFDFGRDLADWTLQRRTDVRTFTQELNLLSTAPGPFQWVAGAYYLDTSTPLNLDFSFQPPVGDRVNAFYSPYGISKHFNRAVFGQVSYAFSPSWSVTLGGRYTEDRLPYHATSFPGPTEVITSTEARSSKPMGKAAINYNVTDDSLLYVSVANGYKAGGGNLTQPSTYGPEENVVEELGLKTTVLDHHLRINADVFDSKYQHIQVQQFVGGTPATTNAAGAKFTGGEAELTGVVGDFRADAGAAYLHGYFSGSFLYSGPPELIEAGSVTPYSPKWQINASAQYDFHVGAGKLTPRVQYSYEDSQTIFPIEAGTTPGPLLLLPSHGILNANMTYEAPANWTLEAYVTNIASKVYVANIVNAGLGPGGYVYDAPRQFGVRVGYRFDTAGK
jgi:iron complex outermembrane recepter protein